ncbi:uncharacterized protein EI90DRAFT_3067037 [Cantharellus anzutake]|uniref:uncharacterized protein n=1 Tax=Cantharellus anzutake TaxID=1750568 RepID=UPI0019057D5C|nr:uncharacterized protein EI90DRAFT_3067037 [Cantharellus anzutake]KAF8327795.1 hypothetical protein EI90DRAFT_3067037 [Cantharellus anzutake]
MTTVKGFMVDMDKIRQRYPNDDPDTWVGSILRCLPRDAFSYVAAADVNGEMTLVLVLNAGDDEEYLRRTLKIPDNESFRQAIQLFLTPGVWPTHE